jgi:hypothetical protein
VTGDRVIPLRPGVGAPADSVARLLIDLPVTWQGEVIGPGIRDWAMRISCSRGRVLKLHGVRPDLRTEIAWMAYWQFRDGVQVSVPALGQLASALAWADATGRLFPPSLADAPGDSITKLYNAWFHARHGRLPSPSGGRERFESLFRHPRLALKARLHTGAWWELDVWNPRCDPRIPLRDREPLATTGCSPGAARLPWVRDAVKWHLGTQLQSGALTWTTIAASRILSLLRFDRWLGTVDDATAVAGDPSRAAGFAAAFRRWTQDPANRTGCRRNDVPSAQPVNKDLRAVAELMSFLLGNRSQSAQVLGPSPWDNLTGAHPAIWMQQISRTRSQPSLVVEEHYVDDHALAQITACLPLLGEPRAHSEVLSATDGKKALNGGGDPQAMRMLLLQILTGRRASEICLCPFDCLSPATARATEAAEGEQIARFRYAQSKIDNAPDTILVDAEVVAVIEEQQQWVREHFPARQPRFLFLQRLANVHGTKPYGRANYGAMLRKFSTQASIVDSAGRPVRLSHTHRFRHTKLTRLAELGLPVHVLQRYAGHTNPTMSMHYVARREEHAEQAFLASRKFKADGTRVVFSQEDHDGMHLFERADRFLPHGYCLLPPLQQCEKGNACLTCGVFVTDDSHLTALRRQLAETTALIERATTQFEHRHGHPMPAGNVWLVQREAERDALLKLLAAMQAQPGRAVQGAGAPDGPVPVSIDIARHRKPQP